LARANLIPAHRREKRSRIRRVRSWVTALGAYGVLLICAYAACFAFGQDESGTIFKEMRETTDRFRASAEQIHILRDSVAESSQQLAAARVLAQNPDWSLLLAMVARNLTKEVVLDRCSLAPVDAGIDANPPGEDETVIYQRYLLDLSGFGQSQTSVSQFVLRLEQSHLFESVRLIKTQTRDFMDGQAVSFRLECTLSGRGGDRS